MRIGREFYQRNTITVAKELLGKYLCRKIGKKTICGKITETEAYRGEEDLACHASKGRTKRTEIMYGEAGHAYVYFCYGMHWMLNIVTEHRDFPAAVLIRGITITPHPNLLPQGAKEKKVDLSGPGKLTRALNITKELNGVDLTKSDEIWIEDRGDKIRKSEIKKSERIGVGYAKHCAHWPWRFFIE